MSASSGVTRLSGSSGRAAPTRAARELRGLTGHGRVQKYSEGWAGPPTGAGVSSNPVLGTQLKWPVKAWKNTTVRINPQSKYHIGTCHDILL